MKTIILNTRKDFPTVPDVSHYGMRSTEPATETCAADPPWLKRETHALRIKTVLCPVENMKRDKEGALRSHL